mmetsp:Transcript_145414/g.451051  ORF Transcript_145414/g.451051 Transcript_145414/m.451051 type:complete len:210 (-) Transcript_145414:51-680(-)
MISPEIKSMPVLGSLRPTLTSTFWPANAPTKTSALVWQATRFCTSHTGISVSTSPSSPPGMAAAWERHCRMAAQSSGSRPDRSGDQEWQVRPSYRRRRRPRASGNSRRRSTSKRCPRAPASPERPPTMAAGLLPSTSSRSSSRRLRRNRRRWLSKSFAPAREAARRTALSRPCNAKAPSSSGKSCGARSRMAQSFLRCAAMAAQMWRSS